MIVYFQFIPWLDSSLELTSDSNIHFCHKTRQLLVSKGIYLYSLHTGTTLSKVLKSRNNGGDIYISLLQHRKLTVYSSESTTPS